MNLTVNASWRSQGFLHVICLHYREKRWIHMNAVYCSMKKSIFLWSTDVKEAKIEPSSWDEINNMGQSLDFWQVLQFRREIQLLIVFKNKDFFSINCFYI